MTKELKNERKKEKRRHLWGGSTGYKEIQRKERDTGVIELEEL